jgi:hypothetical protein
MTCAPPWEHPVEQYGTTDESTPPEMVSLADFEAPLGQFALPRADDVWNVCTAFCEWANIANCHVTTDTGCSNRCLKTERRMVEIGCHEEYVAFWHCMQENAPWACNTSEAECRAESETLVACIPLVWPPGT